MTAKRGGRRQRQWPAHLSGMPAAWGMTDSARTQLSLILRVAMNDIHLGKGQQADVQVLLTNLVVAMAVGTKAADTINGIQAGLAAIAGGINAARRADAMFIAAQGQPVVVAEAERMPMERALRVVEQLHEVANRRLWLEAYREAADPAGLQRMLAHWLPVAEGMPQ